MATAGGYELAMDADDFQPVPGGLHHCGGHHYLHYSDKQLTETPSTVCTTDGHGLPYSAGKSISQLLTYLRRPTWSGETSVEMSIDNLLRPSADISTAERERERERESFLCLFLVFPQGFDAVGWMT